jgi:transcriptional antiterminator RfaH
MNSSSSSAWYVAQTQIQAEAKAGANLVRQGFEVYVPRYLKTVRHARRVNVVKSPLFPSYIFVRIDLETQRWRAINSTVGIKRLVGHEGTPVQIATDLVEGLRQHEQADGFLSMLVPTVRFKAGDAVRMLSGAFDSCRGIFQARTDSQRVEILLEMLGRKVRIITDVRSIEPA